MSKNMKFIKLSMWLLILFVFTSAIYADIIDSLDSAPDTEIEPILEELLTDSDASNKAILTLLNSEKIISLGHEQIPARYVGIMILSKRKQVNPFFYSSLFELAIEEQKRDKNIEGWFSSSMLLAQKTNNDIVPFLIEKLKSEESAVKQLSIILLSNKKDKRAVEPLKKLFLEDGDIFASQALYEILKEEMIPILSEGIKSQNWKVRLFSCHHLGNMGQGFQDLAGVLENDPNQDVRATASFAMRFIKEKDAVDVLIKALGDTSTLVQVKAANTLAVYKKSDAGVDILVKNLNNNNDEIREDAARGLIYARTTDAEEALCQALSNEKIADIRYLLPLALEKHGTSTCLPILFSALQDKDDRVRRNAAAAIKAIIDRHTNQSIPVLEMIIKEGPDISKEKAKEYLRKIDSSKD